MRKLLLSLCAVAACAAPPEGLRETPAGNGPQVNFDVFNKPLPEIPLPNDFATRFSASSPTHRRLNAAIEVAPTTWEKRTREELDGILRTAGRRRSAAVETDRRGLFRRR